MKALAGTDGSRLATEALQMATRLLDPSVDQIAVYYAPPNYSVQWSEGAVAPGVLLEANKAIAKRIMAEAREAAGEQWSESITEIVGDEDPRSGIIKSANKLNADLIVVGAKGLSFIGRLLLGSVSRAVVHRSSKPVLVVRNGVGLADMPLRLLLAYDGSPASCEAVRLLNRFRWPAGSVGNVMTVTQPYFGTAVPDWIVTSARATEMDAAATIWAEQHGQAMNDVRNDLVDKLSELPDCFHGREPIVREGHVAEKILDVVEHDKIDLVIVGARGLNLVSRTLLGSTSEHLLSHAKCSLLVVHTPPPAEE